MNISAGVSRNGGETTFEIIGPLFWIKGRGPLKVLHILPSGALGRKFGSPPLDKVLLFWLPMDGPPGPVGLGLAPKIPGPNPWG